jgi:hypothetical protein
VAGRIREAATYGKWRVEIDGAEAPLVFEGATPAELLPRLRLPAWLRRTSITRYEPYTPQDHQQPLPREELTQVDLNKALDRVSDARSLAAFLEQLRKDPIMSEVGSAEMLIERMQAFLTDTATDGGYMQRYANVSGKGWRLAGDLVFSSFVYE